MLIHFTRYPQF